MKRDVMNGPDPTRDAAAWPRWAARASLAAAFVCFATNCVFMQLTRRQLPSETELANQIVGWSSMAVLIVGVIAGGAALVGSLKSGNRETFVMAVMGVFFNGGIIAATMWLLYQISQSRT